MKRFVRLGVKTYSYLIHDGSEDKKAKDTKTCVIKRKPKLEHYKNFSKATQIEDKINHREKNEI